MTGTEIRSFRKSESDELSDEVTRYQLLKKQEGVYMCKGPKVGRISGVWLELSVGKGDRNEST